jgi:hypothetical protein
MPFLDTGRHQPRPCRGALARRHDWAAFVARHPARTASLTLMATTAFMPTRESWYERAALVRRTGTQALLEATLSRWFT